MWTTFYLSRPYNYKMEKWVDIWGHGFGHPWKKCLLSIWLALNTVSGAKGVEKKTKPLFSVNSHSVRRDKHYTNTMDHLMVVVERATTLKTDCHWKIPLWSRWAGEC